MKTVSFARLLRTHTLVALAGALAIPAAEPINKAWLQENYTKYEHLIPMRDRVKLLTVVYAPKDLSTNYPIWMFRTPYGLRPYGADVYPEPRRALSYYGRDKFIFVGQDVRGRNGSEGEFLHVRPIKAANSGPTVTDESTDTWDTIEWLVKNTPNNNGRVGLSGISYPGFYAACGAIDSHPALKVVSPQAPVSDWFQGDDFHHNGALYLPHAFNFLGNFEQRLAKPTREDAKPFDYETPDGYEFYLNLGPLANADSRFFKGAIPFWNDMMQHPNYDSFWQSRNLLPNLRNVHTAVMTVGGWFDAEDLFGALNVYSAMERQNAGITNILVMGPWSHGQWYGDDGDHLGAVRFQAKTSEFFRQSIELPFFNFHLKGGPDPKLPEAYVFETGTSQWRRYDAWPPKQSVAKTLYFQPAGGLSFEKPASGTGEFDEYVSDPAKPVPFIPNISIAMTREHMLEDQRFASTRPDVVTYQTALLEEDVTLAGPLTAQLTVSTTGTDSDWVVKVIDVYSSEYPNPDPNPAGLQMGRYQQLVRGELMRGKFRNGFDKPEAFEPSKPSVVKWTLPDAYHTFRRGHRIMVQVQSSWFPLADRNPQTFCDIYHAKPEDFVKATQRVYRSGNALSGVEIRILPTR